VARIIRLKAPYIEKLWSPIFNQSNIKRWKWEQENQLYKNIQNKKIIIKRMKIKIKIKHKLEDYKSEIENKNYCNKRTKKNKDQIGNNNIS